MHTIDIILHLLEKQSKTQKDLCEYLTIKKQAFTDWKSGKSKSYKKYLPEIAEFFDVSVDYLIGNTDQKEKKPDGISGELWEELCKDESKKRLAIWILQMSPNEVERVVKLLEAAQLLPTE